MSTDTVAYAGAGQAQYPTPIERYRELGILDESPAAPQIQVGRCQPWNQLHRWACKHEKTCECGEVTRAFVPDGL